jgi:regulatory protein
MEDATFARYYNLSLRYLSFRPRSEKEVLDYLKEKQKKAPNLTDDIVYSIMAKLQEYKFINDFEFAKFWLKQRTQYKNKPIRVVRYELTQKGISRSLIDEILEDQENKEVDLESAKKLATKKLDFYRNLPEDKRQEKVMNHLLRKGFSYDIVKKVLKD